MTPDAKAKARNHLRFTQKGGVLFSSLRYKRCIICDSGQLQPLGKYGREEPSCRNCGSSWRNRATVTALIEGLGTRLKPLVDWDEDFSRYGVGFDDPPVLFTRLSSKLQYTNTHLHRFPTLDIISPPETLHFTLEFAIASELLEHVSPDADPAVKGLSQIIKPGGFAIVTVPEANEHREFYPGLDSLDSIEPNEVIWTDKSGQSHIDNSPEFHGGTGNGLALRVFSEQSLRKAFLSNGFSSLGRVLGRPEYGVEQVELGGVFIARKPS